MPFDPPPPPRDAMPAITAWNMMRGLDWAALPTVIDVLGIDDVETLIAQLTLIRDNEANNG